MSSLVELEGKRVRLILGLDGNDKQPRKPYNLWCAGAVPVGSEGVVVFNKQPFKHLAIIWDDPELRPKAGYSYMIHDDDIDFLEVL